MKLLVLAAVMAASFSGAANAQRYEPDTKGSSAREEYRGLFGRAAEKEVKARDSELGWPDAPVKPKPVRKSAPKVVEREAPTREVLRREEPVEVAEYLNDPSDFADEPHRVKVVDRSKFNEAFVPTTIPNTIGLTEGSILIDTKARQLYFAMPGGMVRRYGVAVGKAGATWRGTAVVGRMARWPDWYPTPSIRKENRKLKARVAGGASNPLGARAIYLYQDGRDTLYRIHGTNAPMSIGKFASHGCIRMINEDVIELYGMVAKGATVQVR